MGSVSTFQFINGITQLGDAMVALFDDGTYTNDIATAFDQGVSASRARNPEDWGEYQIRGGELLLRENGESTFDDPLNYMVEPGGSNSRITGCYTALSGGSLDLPGVAVSTNTWCFDSSGRFTNDSAAFVSNSTVSASSSRDTSGEYRIDGYAIRIRYSNGIEKVMSFCYYSEDRTHIGLNGRRFF